MLRTLPIRVAGESGPLFAETTWEQLADESNGYIRPERTTVTNLIRRVGRWDSELAREAVQANGGVPTVRAERLVNLVLCLLATRQYLTAERIRGIVPGYTDAPSDDAFFRMFERDKAELRDLGIPLETGRNSVFDSVDGYRIARRDYELGDIDLDLVRSADHVHVGGPEFLGDAAGRERAALLQGLLALDVHYRRRRGESPTADEYRRRFPGHGEQIDAVLFRPPTGSEPAVPAAPPPRPPVLVQSIGGFIPELGESLTTAQKRNVDRLAVQIVSMMEKPW